MKIVFSKRDLQIMLELHIKEMEYFKGASDEDVIASIWIDDGEIHAEAFLRGTEDE